MTTTSSRWGMAIAAAICLGMLGAACGDDDSVGTDDPAVPSSTASTTAPGSDVPAAPVSIDDALVLAIDGPSASPVWSIPITEETPSAADYLTVGEGIVATGDTSCSGAGTLLFARDGSGEVLGQVDGLPDSFAGPSTVGTTADGHFVSAGFEDGGAAFAVGIDAAEGTESWRVDLDGLETADLRGETVVLTWTTESGSTVVALDRTTGDEQWRVEVPDLALYGLRVSDGVVVATGYVPGGEGASQMVAVLDTADGTELARAPLSAGSDRNSVEIVDGVVVGVDPTVEALVALDAATGTEAWRVPGLTLVQPVAEEAHVVGDGVLAQRGFGGSLVLVDAATGEVRFEIDGGLVGVTDELVVVSDGVDTVAALDAATGAERWSISSADVEGSLDRFGAAFVVGDRLYLLAACEAS